MATQHTPQHQQAAEHWQIVAGALADLGVNQPRPAPKASIAFVPRQLREGARHG